MAQGELHDRVHKKMSAALDALSVFKDGRRANSLWPTLVLQTGRVCSVYSTHKREVSFTCRCQVCSISTESVTLIPSSNIINKFSLFF